MLKFGLPLAILLASAAPVMAAPRATPAAKALHESLIVLDTHFDTPANMASPSFDMRVRHQPIDGSQVDYPRMIEGGVDGGFFAIFTPQGPNSVQGNQAARDHALLRAVVIHEMVAKNGDVFQLVTKADDAESLAKAGKKKFVFISMENGSPVAGDLSLMKTFYDLGVRMMSPVHFANNDLADSATDPKGPTHGGLSPLGRQFVAEANRLGVLLDASHASDATTEQMIELSKAPIILSHSGVRAAYDHPRNAPDELIRKLAAKGGVIQLNALSGYMIDTPPNSERRAALVELDKAYGDPNVLPADRLKAYRDARRAILAKYPVPRATIDDLVKHIVHAAQVAGKDHIGLSGDFDGGGGLDGFDDITDFPMLTQKLLAAGFTKDDLAGFWGGNALRVLKQADEMKGK